MNMLIICLFLFLTSGEADVGKQNNPPPSTTVCSFSYQTDLADKEPVFLTSSKFGYEILKPENSIIKLKANDEIYLSCPGVNNKLTGLNKDVISARCVKDKTFTVDNKQIEIKQISCDKKVTGQFLDSTEICGKHGVTKYLGHKLADKWFTIINICYDHNRGESLYAKHTLYGAAVDYGKDGKNDAGFKIGGLEFQVKPKDIISSANLKKIFTNLLQSPTIVDQYLNPKSTLINAQLSPKNDFILSPAQYSTFYYVNTVPQWQIINSNNWKSLEESIRKTASSLKENFKIITGTHDVLTLKNKNGQETKMYLDVSNTLPIPKYIWKIIYSLKTKKAIAFVNLNNPFVSKNEYLCTDICDKNGWGNSVWKDAKKGLVYCCDVKQLMEKVSTIPNLENIAGIQEGKLDSKPVVVQPKPTPTVTGCDLNLVTDFPGKNPLLIKKVGLGFELKMPENDVVSFSPKQEILLACSNPSNSISKLNKKSVSATCVSGKQFKIDGKTYNFNEITCNQRVIGDLKSIPKECGGRGLSKKIGYKIETDNFLPIIEVCYDHKEGEPLYSEHVLYGSSIDYRKTEVLNQDFKIAGLEFRVNGEDDFKKENQLIRFEKLLGNKVVAAKYISANSFLARAHLAPVADFIFGSSKYSTYYYINTVPQWQIINNGNWKSLEKAIRTTASVLQKNFQIVTGGFKTLSLKNSDKKDVEIYLDIADTLPVPKYIWKIIYAADTKKGIAFVSLNNPFVETGSDTTPICPNVCKKYGWSTPEWEKNDKGLLYCCEIKELMKVIDTIPDLGPIVDVQEFKKKMKQ